MENLDKMKPSVINDLAKKNAEVFVLEDKLKTHQLRNVFSSIEKIRNDYRKKLRTLPKDKTAYNDHFEELETSLILLKPKIAYAAGRQKTVRFSFFPFVQDSIDAVLKAEDKKLAYQNFFALMESVVAYHKYFESK